MTTEELKKECEDIYCPYWVGQGTKDLVWRLAWVYGHLDGIDEVKYHYDNFMDIANLVYHESKGDTK